MFDSSRPSMNPLTRPFSMFLRAKRSGSFGGSSEPGASWVATLREALQSRPQPATADPTGSAPIVIDQIERNYFRAVGAAIILGFVVALAAAYGVWRGAPLSSAMVVIVLAPAIAVDVAVRQIPDRLIGIAIVAGVCVQFGDWMNRLDDSAGTEVLRMGAGALALGGPLLLIHLIRPSAMGFGDVKAGLVLGAAVGLIDWRLGLTTLALAAGVSAIVGLARRQHSVPFGPGLITAAAFSLAAPAALVPDVVLAGGWVVGGGW